MVMFGLLVLILMVGDFYVFIFKQLGCNGLMNLYGVDVIDSFNFDVLVLLVVIGVYVMLYYMYLFVLLLDLLQINVLVNDVVVGSILLFKENLGSMQIVKVDILFKLIIEFNCLSLQFIGYYIMGCEDFLYFSLWVCVVNGFILDLQIMVLLQKDDLVLMFVFFFDWCDICMLNLFFIFVGMFDNGMLEVVGLLLFWFGVLVVYCGVCFLVQINILFQCGNVVLMVVGEVVIIVVGVVVVVFKGLILIVQVNLNDVNGKLLIVFGCNIVEFKQVVVVLMLGGKGLVGSLVVVDKLQLLIFCQLYDVFNWLFIDCLVKFFELIDFKCFNVFGYNLGEIIILFNFLFVFFSW